MTSSSKIHIPEVTGAYPRDLRGYGSRSGVWRILHEFESRNLPLTVFGVAMALLRYPELLASFMHNGYEIANHGLRCGRK